jgi:hypothetical protein
MQVWLAAEVQLLSVSGFPSDIPIAANPLHRRGIEATTGSRPKHLPAANPSPMQARYVSHSACYRFPAGARQELSSVLPDRLQLMVIALPAPRAYGYRRPWGLAWRVQAGVLLGAADLGGCADDGAAGG